MKMEKPMPVGMVVQFTEAHKWCGCLGIIYKVKHCGNDIRYMIGVQIPEQGIAYIFVMGSANEIESIGKAVLIWEDDDNEEDEE